MVKFFKYLFPICLVIFPAWSADLYYAELTSRNYQGTHSWQNGDTVYFTGDVCFSGEVEIKPGVKLRMNNNALIKMLPGSKLTAVGNSAKPIDLRSSQAANKHRSIMIDQGASAHISYLNIHDAKNGFIFKSDDVVLEYCQVISPTDIGILIKNAAPKIFFTKVANPVIFSLGFYFDDINFDFPVFYGCGFDRGNNGHHVYFQANNIDSNRNYYLEGNYWGGHEPNMVINIPATYTVNLDPYPELSVADSNNLSFKGATDHKGRFNADFYFFGNKNYSLANSNLAVADGVTLYMGTDGLRESYLGGTNFSLAQDSSLIVENGGQLVAKGLPNNKIFFKKTNNLWEKLQFDPGAIVKLENVDIQGGKTGLEINTAIFTSNGLDIHNCSVGVDLLDCDLTAFSGAKIFNCTVGLQTNGFKKSVTNCNFLSNPTNVKLISGATDFHGNRLEAGIVGVEVRSNATIRNNIFLKAPNLIKAVNSTARIYSNTFDCTNSNLPKMAILVAGTSVPNISKNNFINCAKYIENNANVRLTAEKNWYGSNPPIHNRFSGIGEIDYEPWLHAESGTDVDSPPTPAVSIYPVNGKNFDVSPEKLIFSTYDIGYYNGKPLDYWLQLADNVDFNSPLIDKKSYPATGTGAGSFAGDGTYANDRDTEYNLATVLPMGHRYYWRIKARDRFGTNDWSDWSKIFYFDIARPDVQILLNSSVTAAKAGEQFFYTINCWNNDNVHQMNNGKVVFVLPNEVMSNGELTISNVPAGVGVTVNAYADPEGNNIIAQTKFLATGADYILKNGQNWNLQDLSVDENVLLKRFDILIERLDSRQSATVKVQVINR